MSHGVGIFSLRRLLKTKIVKDERWTFCEKKPFDRTLCSYNSRLLVAVVIMRRLSTSKVRITGFH